MQVILDPPDLHRVLFLEQELQVQLKQLELVIFCFPQKKKKHSNPDTVSLYEEYPSVYYSILTQRSCISSYSKLDNSLHLERAFFFFVLHTSLEYIYKQREKSLHSYK